MSRELSELLERLETIEQVGVLRALIFLLEGERTFREFEEIMSGPTFVKARSILVDTGLITVRPGLNRAKIHSLTEKGVRVAELLVNILELL